MKTNLYRFSDAGLKNVWLVNGYTIKRTRYGDAVAIQDVAGLTRVICRALVVIATTVVQRTEPVG